MTTRCITCWIHTPAPSRHPVGFTSLATPICYSLSFAVSLSPSSCAQPRANHRTMKHSITTLTMLLIQYTVSPLHTHTHSFSLFLFLSLFLYFAHVDCLCFTLCSLTIRRAWIGIDIVTLQRRTAISRALSPTVAGSPCVYTAFGVAADTRFPLAVKTVKTTTRPIRHSAMFTTAVHRKRAADTITTD